MAYHSSGLDHLLREVFSRFADHMVDIVDALLAAPADRDQGREVVTDLVQGLSEGNQRGRGVSAREYRG